MLNNNISRAKWSHWDMPVSDEWDSGEKGEIFWGGTTDPEPIDIGGDRMADRKCRIQ